MAGKEMSKAADPVAGTHKHRCMRCDEEFDCQSIGTCTANYNVLPTIVKPDRTMVEHCPRNPDWDWIRAYGKRRLGASGVPSDLLIRCKKTGGTLIYERTAPNEITVYHESGCEAGASGVDVPRLSEFVDEVCSMCATMLAHFKQVAPKGEIDADGCECAKDLHELLQMAAEIRKHITQPAAQEESK